MLKRATLIYLSARTLEQLGVLLVNERSQISSVIEDHVERLTVGESTDGLLKAPLVLLLSLSLPRKDGNAGGGDAGQAHMISSGRSSVRQYCGGGLVTHAAAA